VVPRRLRYLTFRTVAGVTTIWLLLGLATSVLYYRHVTRRMNEWHVAAKAAGLRAKIETHCVVKWLERYPLCRQYFPSYEPEVRIGSDEQMFTLLGVKPQCPTRLRVYCPAGRVRFVVLAVAKEALDVEVHLYGDDTFGGRPKDGAPFTSERTPWKDE
jgi:hypothetical protein